MDEYSGPGLYQDLQQKTGTPPYMAHGLLLGWDALHLYRHDLESLFYIILILATHYEIQPPEEGKKGGIRTRDGDPPYRKWFNEPIYENLGSFKAYFFANLRHPNLSPAFEVFRDWLSDIRLSFRRGLRSKGIYEDELMVLRWHRDGGSEGEVTPEFDDETLGGHVHYSALIDPVRKLGGELKGLIIHYDPSLSASTGLAKADG